MPLTAIIPPNTSNQPSPSRNQWSWTQTTLHLSSISNNSPLKVTTLSRPWLPNKPICSIQCQTINSSEKPSIMLLKTPTKLQLQPRCVSQFKYLPVSKWCRTCKWTLKCSLNWFNRWCNREAWRSPIEIKRTWSTSVIRRRSSDLLDTSWCR